jgi:LysR family transcriptional activator of nhaA
MTPLNYNHLYYFYMVAREGSIAVASQKLNLTPQTVSGQISKFEDHLSLKLFERQGKRMQMSESGLLIYEQAKAIFQMGEEIQYVLNQQSPKVWRRFNVGLTDVVPKVLALRLLKSVFDLPQNIRLVCHEGDQEKLLADLAVNKLDCVLTDQPLAANSPIKAFNHSIAHSGLSFFAVSQLASPLKEAFPTSLHLQPFLLPGRQSLVRDLILSWFNKHDISPQIVAEFDDSALLKAFGKEGYGVFVAPTLIEKEVIEQYGVDVIGRTDECIERYYVISPERKIRHPATKHLIQTFHSEHAL